MLWRTVFQWHKAVPTHLNLILQLRQNGSSERDPPGNAVVKQWHFLVVAIHQLQVTKVGVEEKLDHFGRCGTEDGRASDTKVELKEDMSKHFCDSLDG